MHIMPVAALGFIRIEKPLQTGPGENIGQLGYLRRGRYKFDRDTPPCPIQPVRRCAFGDNSADQDAVSRTTGTRSVHLIVDQVEYGPNTQDRFAALIYPEAPNSMQTRANPAFQPKQTSTLNLPGFAETTVR